MSDTGTHGEFLFEGDLLKLGWTSPTWTKRYFEVSKRGIVTYEARRPRARSFAHPAAASWYDPDSKKAKGRIFLRPQAYLSESCGVVDAIAVYTPKRILYLRSPAAEDGKEVLGRFTEAVRQLLPTNVRPPKSGMLTKRSRERFTSFSWRERFFVVFGGTIQYFENEGKPFRGFMSLQGAFISLDKTVANRALCLEITDGLTESIVIQAPTRTDMDDWFACIQDHIQSAGFTTLPSDDPPLYYDVRELQASAGAAEGEAEEDAERLEQERRMERLRRASVAMEQRAMHESLRRQVEGRNMAAQIDFLEHVVEQMARFYLVSGIKIRKYSSKGDSKAHTLFLKRETGELDWGSRKKATIKLSDIKDVRRGVEDSEAFAAAKKSVNERLAVSVQTTERSFDVVFVEPHTYPPVVTYLEMCKIHNEIGEDGGERSFPFEDIIHEEGEEESEGEGGEDYAADGADAAVAPAGDTA